jgi:L-aminopeptidase/D-esterase-like protein
MDPMHVVERVHAVLLAGGSAFGLDAASGVVRYLEEKGVGFDIRIAKVPIVPTAILLDLGIGRSDVRPDAEMGYQACLNASDKKPMEGNAGAGMGATVGKVLGLEGATKSGIGTASIDLGHGVVVGAIMAVNAAGDVFDPQNGRILAGSRDPQGKGKFVDSMQVLKGFVGMETPGFSPPENTVIGVVATNAALNKVEVNKVAQMAHDGIARTIRPAHTMFDGDTIFALSLGNERAHVNIIGAYAAEVVAVAIVNAVLAAEGVAGLPAARDL